LLIHEGKEPVSSIQPVRVPEVAIPEYPNFGPPNYAHAVRLRTTKFGTVTPVGKVMLLNYAKYTRKPQTTAKAADISKFLQWPFWWIKILLQVAGSGSARKSNNILLLGHPIAQKLIRNSRVPKFWTMIL